LQNYCLHNRRLFRIRKDADGDWATQGGVEVERWEQAQLSALAVSRSLPHAMVARAQLVLWAAQGENNSAIAERLGWSLPGVGKWCQRFVEQGIDQRQLNRPVALTHDFCYRGRAD
jgi:hypothetical protein